MREQATCLSYPSLNPPNGGVKLTPSLKEVPLSPFPRKRAPRRLLRGGTSRSHSAKAFSDCVTRFRGGALRHAKFPKTSYKVQLLDTRLHGRCVNPDRSRGRGLIFLSSKVLVHFWQNASVLSGEGNPSHSLFCYIALRHLRTPPERPAAFRRLSLLSSRRGSQAKPAAQSAGKTLREEKAVTRKECAKAHTGFAPQCKHCYHAGAGNDSLKRCFFRPFESL